MRYYTRLVKLVITNLFCSIGIFFCIHFLSDQAVSSNSSKIRFGNRSELLFFLKRQMLNPNIPNNIIGVNLFEVFSLDSLLDLYGGVTNQSYSIRFLNKDGATTNKWVVKIVLSIHSISYDVILIDVDDFGRITKIKRGSEIEDFLLRLTLNGLESSFTKDGL